MGDNVENVLCQLLTKIENAVAANNSDEVSILLRETRRKFDEGKDLLDDETASLLEDFLSRMVNLQRAMNSRPVSVDVGFSAERPKTGARGRPRVSISRGQLHHFQQANYSGIRMAQHFQCSKKTVYRKLWNEGLSLKERYTDISDCTLDAEITELKKMFPKAGSQMMQGYLTSKGIHVQRIRIRNSINRLDPGGSAERWATSVHRRVYSVSTPNSLWHLNGHMKLIRWGFVTHGCIDGFSRFITFLHCGTDNTASSVLKLFVPACEAYGVPSRVRSDHGGENTKVALFLNLVRQRPSHITGKSTHNQRIERLWRDVHYQATSKFYEEFYSMEVEGNLDLDDDNHRSALKYVYLPIINKCLNNFRNGWNQHKLRSEKHQSPYQIWLSGLLDNMGSNNTATSEVFQQPTTLTERLVNSLNHFGLTLDDVNESNPDAQTNPFTTEQQNLIEMEATNQRKFLKCVQLFQSLNPQ